MFDIRKIVVVLLIAILFTVFVFSTIDAIYPSPDYDDFCDNNRAMLVEKPDACPSLPPVPGEERVLCEGDIAYEYDALGCPTTWYCETCRIEYEAASDKYHQIMFYVSAALALIVIFISLNLPVKKKNNINEWVGTGLLLGGAFVLLFGTVQGFNTLDRFVKPIVMLAELVLVIYLAYKKFK